MGIQCTGYLGPYIQVNNQFPGPEVKIEKQVKINVCLNSECNFFKKSSIGKFCQQCGFEIKEFEFTKTKIVKHELHLNEICETLLDENLSTVYGYEGCLIPNIGWGCNETERIDSKNENNFEDITNINIQKIIIEFEILFKKEIEILKLHFKDVRVGYCWLNYLM